MYEENLYANREEVSSEKRDKVRNILRRHNWWAKFNVVLVSFYLKVKFNIKNLEASLIGKNPVCIFSSFLGYTTI